ncbi:MAG TPA: SDR family NAD(P)-dependent oxidoreductase [Coxiellaceae bacterium]|nr:SDR family NAD(P)-dependent oxidoreductase [Coxiellaceae bacterium]
MKKIVITGADGFIGSHLVEKMVALGYEVHALVLYNALGSYGWLDHIDPVVKSSIRVSLGDIRDAAFVDSLVLGCDAVMHLAALIAIPYSYINPSAYVQTNVIGTLNLLQAVTKQGIEKMMHTSTSEVYGTAQFVPITEQHPLNAQSPYAASKIAADQFALSFYRSFKTPVAIVRPFNTYGPRQSVRAIIPTIIQQINAGKKNIELGAVTPTRDFSFVEDTVNGMIAVFQSSRSIGEVINLGSGFEISIKETADIIAQAMGVTVNVSSVENRVRPKLSEVDRLHASIEKAKALLEWSPHYAGLDGFSRGIKATVEWFSQEKNTQHFHDRNYIV